MLLNWRYFLLFSTKITLCRRGDQIRELFQWKTFSQEVFDLAGDGKESNVAGPRLRIREGRINYL
jgi:hypothetical protein